MVVQPNKAIVGANAFAKFLIQAIVRHKARHFDDRAKADAFLRERLAAEKDIARPA